MTETPSGGAVATTNPSQAASGSSSKSGSTGSSYSYYPKTDVEYGLMWNDGKVTRTYGTAGNGARDAIKYFMNSIKLRRIGVYTKNFYATGIVTREVIKRGASSSEWEERPWTRYELTREDMLELYKAG